MKGDKQGDGFESEEHSMDSFAQRQSLFFKSKACLNTFMCS